jgi:hypothetical protein
LLLLHHQVQKLRYKTNSIKYYNKHQLSCPTVAHSGLGLPRTDGNAQILLASKSQETLWAQRTALTAAVVSDLST